MPEDDLVHGAPRGGMKIGAETEAQQDLGKSVDFHDRRQFRSERFDFDRLVEKRSPNALRPGPEQNALQGLPGGKPGGHIIRIGAEHCQDR